MLRKTSSDLGKKSMVVSVKGQFTYTIDGNVVHQECGDCEKEIEYGEFFDRVIAAGGDESLLQMSDRAASHRVKKS